MKRKLKILLVGLSGNRGGVESYILNMVHNLSQDAFEFYLPANGAEITYGDEISNLGGHFIHVPKGRGIHFLSYYLGWWRILRYYKFDVIYWNDCSIVSLDVLQMAKWSGVPVRIFHAHSSAMDTPMKGIRKILERHNFRTLPKIATHLLACSQSAAQWMFPSNTSFQIIPNAIDTRKFAYSLEHAKRIRKHLDIESQFVVGFIGRLTPAKNPEFFVQIAHSILQKAPHFVFLLAGAGEQEEDVRKLAESLNLIPPQFCLLGARSDIADLVQALDCLVMPSCYEGLPIALVEAQAAGLPCFVSDTVSRECDLTGNIHFLSLKQSPETWATAIMHKLNNPEDRSEGADKVRKAGFDAAQAFANVEKLLLQYR